MIDLYITRSTSMISGAEKYNLYLFSQFKDKKKFRVRIISNNLNFLKIFKKYKFTTFYRPDLISEVGTKKELLKTLIHLPKYISLVRFFTDIKNSKNKSVVIMESITEKIFLTHLLKKLKFKIIWIEHGPVFKTNKSSIVKILYKVATHSVDRIICVSKDTEKDLKSKKIKKTITIYTGVDTSMFSKTKKSNFASKGNQSKKFTVGFIGGVNEEKGILRFIEVAKKVNDSNANTFFIVLGDGPLLIKAKEDVSRLKLNRYFSFTGFLNDIHSQIQLIDLLFLPTDHSEGISLAILECIASGVIVYTHDVGGNSEVIKDKINGFLYKEYNSTKIAKKIVKLIDSKKQIVQLRTEAYKTLNSFFNLEKNSLIFKKVIETV